MSDEPRYYKPSCHISRFPAEQQTFFMLLGEVRKSLMAANMADRCQDFLRKADQIEWRDDQEDLWYLAYEYVELV